MNVAIKLCFLCCIVLLPISVFADSPVHPFSYEVFSSNNKFVFAMIAPVSFEEDGEFENDENEAKAKNVRSRYTKSGLYINNGSTNPVWTVDWYAPIVYLAADGTHLIRERYPPAENLDDEAITFFANGKEIRTYKVGDFIDSTRFVPKSAAFIYWDERIYLDDERRTLTLITWNKKSYIFDYTTGEIVSSRNPVRVVAFIIVAVLILLVIAIIKRRSANSFR